MPFTGLNKCFLHPIKQALYGESVYKGFNCVTEREEI